MHKRKIILALLLVLTIAMIALVKFILQKEIESTEQARLNFYTEHVNQHKSNTIKSFNSTARYVQTLTNAQLKTNPNPSFSQINNITSKIDYLSVLFHDQLSDLNIEYIRFLAYGNNNLPTQLNNNRINSIHDAFSSLTDTDTTIQGVISTNEACYYAIYFPLILDNQYTGAVKVCFNTNAFIDGLAFGNPIDNAGIYRIANNNGISELKTSFQIDNNNGSSFIKLVSEALAQPYNDKPISTTFSLISKKSMVLTISPIDLIDNEGKAFLAIGSGDYIIKKAKEMNDAILIINIFIIVFVMGGFSFTIINRFKVVKEKKEIQQSENRLKELNESKDKFFSIVAHDLKNPFNGIMGLSGYLISDYDNVDEEERKEIINDINLASKNAFNLLQNLLEWTRAQSGTIKNNPVIIEPRRIVDLALETVTNLAKNKDIALVEKFNTEARGYADENLIATVIRNLVTNAIKFSPRGKNIEIVANYYQDELYFVVKDYGIGLSSDEIDQLFRIDVNFHKRGTEKETGTGLGLKLCKEFVEYCNGRIWVVSEPGKGSSFFFTIPLYKK